LRWRLTKKPRGWIARGSVDLVVEKKSVNRRNPAYAKKRPGIGTFGDKDETVEFAVHDSHFKTNNFDVK